MAVSLLAVDYSRPIQPLFEQPSRVGTIRSIFPRAMNIALDGSMLAVLSSELPRMPNSVRLPPLTTKELLRNLRPGLPVALGNGRLHIPSAHCSLYLPQALPWEPRPDLPLYGWHRETVAHYVRSLTRYLAEQAGRSGLSSLAGPLLLGQSVQETPLARMALPVLRLLVRAAWQQDSAGIKEAARGLAGLGPGLTPSGDDVLGGFAAVMALLSLYLSADGVSRAHIAPAIATVVGPRTTALSAALLAHAARGEVAEHLGKLLLSLALPAGATEAVLHAADAVLAFGASSGADTLLGVVLGLRALQGDTDEIGG